MIDRIPHHVELAGDAIPDCIVRISESAQIRETVYPKPSSDPKKLPELSYSYVYQFTPVMERRLSQAGVRLAAYLNAIYAEPQPLPAEPKP